MGSRPSSGRGRLGEKLCRLNGWLGCDDPDVAPIRPLDSLSSTPWPREFAVSRSQAVHFPAPISSPLSLCGSAMYGDSGGVQSLDTRLFTAPLNGLCGMRKRGDERTRTACSARFDETKKLA